MNQNQTSVMETKKMQGIGIYVSVLVSMTIILLSVMILVNVLPPLDVIKLKETPNMIEYHQNKVVKSHNDFPKSLAN